MTESSYEALVARLSEILNLQSPPLAITFSQIDNVVAEYASEDIRRFRV